MMSIVWTIVVLVVLACLLAVALAVANKFFKVEEDNRKEEVMKHLPGANCGACTYPGCSGLAYALIEGKVTHVKQCKAIKDDQANVIKDYLNSTPGPDGSTLKVDL